MLRFIGFMIVGLLVAGCDNTTALEHQQRARNYFDEAEYRTAVIELKNALQKDPNLGSAREFLGQVYLILGDYPGALKEFERARDLGLNQEPLLVGLLSSKVHLGRYQEVIGELADQSPLAPALEVILGDAYLAAGDIERARMLYRRTEALAGANLGLGTIAWMEGDLVLAASYFDRSLAIDATIRETWIRQGELRLSQQRYEAAIESFQKARDLPGGAVSGQLGLARAYLAQANLEQARIEVDGVLQSAPGLFVAHYLDALIHYQQQDLDGAEKALREVQRAMPDHAPSLYLMGAVKFQQNQLNQAEDNLQRYLAQAGPNASVAKLLAAIRMQRGELEGIYPILQPYLEVTSDPQLLAMAGTAELRAGNLTEATRLFERAVEVAPDAAAFRNQLALSLISAGEEDRARGVLAAAISVDGKQFHSDYLLALLSLKNGDYDTASTAIDAMVEKSPESPLGYNLRGAVNLAQNDEAGAVRSFEKALELAPEYLPAVSNLARLDERAGDSAAARQRYVAFLQRVPDSQGASLALADLSARTGDPNGAEQVLLDLIELQPELLTARLGLCRLYLRQDRVSDAAEQAEVALRIGPDVAEALMLSAEVALRQGELALARARGESLQKVLSQGTPKIEQLYALGVLQVRVGQFAPARENLERVLDRSGGGHGGTLLELARLDLREGHVADARARWQTLQNLGVGGEQPLLLEAEILRAEGDMEAATDRYAELASAGVRDGALRLAMARLSQNEVAAAIAGLDSWLATHPDDLGMKMVRGNALLQGNDKEAAIAQYEALVAVDNPVVLNNLAWLYMERGDERALATAERAHSLAPESGDIADTLGWILVQTGQPERAIDHLRRSVDKDPGNPTLHYHLGVAYLESGNLSAGRAALERAVGTGEFPELTDARARLEAIGS